jgi:hypothetical protein
MTAKPQARRLDARRWEDGADALHDALVERLGHPHGAKGSSRAAFRQATRRLADHGVVAEALDRLLIDYAVETLKTLGPMPLASFLDGKLKVVDQRYVAVQRWATGCVCCEREVGRGEHVWLRRTDDGKWAVTCGDCEEIDHGSERAAQARLKALAKDGDPEALVTAILDHAPADLREEIEDDLALVIEASRPASPASQ